MLTMLVTPLALILMALTLDICFSCLGKKFMLTYPVTKKHMFTAVVTVYTYHQHVTVRRDDKITIPGHYGRKPDTMNMTLTRFKKVHFPLQFNASMYKDHDNLDHIVILDGDKEFGVNLMLLGLEHSVATMTILPVEYHGTEYYPFFLSKNQIYMVLMQRSLPLVSAAQLTITFYFTDKYMRTLHHPIDSLQVYPYRCDNNEVYGPYQGGNASTAVGYPAFTKEGTLCIIVGNCYVEEKRIDASAKCPIVDRDDLIDMPLGTQFAAMEFIAFKGIHHKPNRSYVAVMGIVPSTSVKVYHHKSMRLEFTVRKGQARKVYLSDPYQLITSTRAIQVYLLFTSSCHEDEVGGPSMTSLIPSALFHNRYIWNLPYYLKITERNYLVVIKRTNQHYGFVFNKDYIATDNWSWQTVSGTGKWQVSENEIQEFPNVFTLSSSTNRAFGLYLYGVDIAISYLHFVDFLNAVTYKQRHFCFETNMVVGDRIDNDCDGFPDEESSQTSDDDEDGKLGEDVRGPVSSLFLMHSFQQTYQKPNMKESRIGPNERKTPVTTYILWIGLLGIMPVPVIMFVYELSKMMQEGRMQKDQIAEQVDDKDFSAANAVDSDARQVAKTSSPETAPSRIQLKKDCSGINETL